MTVADRERIAIAFDDQVAWCRRLGAPFTAQLLTEIADAIRRGEGSVAPLIQWQGDPKADALPLRIAAALHALVLMKQDDGLSAFWPQHPTPLALWPTVAAALDRHQSAIEHFLNSPPQTNEVGRSTLLMGGLLEIADHFRRPLSLLEIGASAGLNQMVDLFRFQMGPSVYGPEDSDVQLKPDWCGPSPKIDAPLMIASRMACDRRPVDLGHQDERLRLMAYVWADQPHRTGSLAAAISLAEKAGVKVERADAADWTETSLAIPIPDIVPVLFHSVVWDYLPSLTQGRIKTSLFQYVSRAALAWLRLEPDADGEFALTLALWDGNGTEPRERILAVSHPHGAWVDWRG